MSITMQKLIEPFGGDNAESLCDTLCRGTKNYDRCLWIPMGVEPANWVFQGLET
jgi:hypothetical protein